MLIMGVCFIDFYVFKAEAFGVLNTTFNNREVEEITSVSSITSSKFNICLLGHDFKNN